MLKRTFTLSGVVALALILIFIFTSLASASSPRLAPPAAGELYAPDRILVRFAPGVSASTMAAIHRANGAVLIREIPQIGVQVLRVPSNRVPELVAAYSRNPNVLYAEPDYVAHAIGTPDDTYFDKQWGMHNTGQTGGAIDADIDAPEAWDITIGTAGIKIAILDTGIDQNHPDLDDKLVGNINFTDSSTVDDLYGHGTHVAGIAAAETNNTQGVAGVGYNSSLLNVKVLDDQGSGYYSWIASGITWATDNGAKVINMSLGGYFRSSTLENAVNYAWNKGVVLAAAAGNDGTSRKLYPAAYTNCIAVAATNDDDQRVNEPGWWASNYGDWVDVAAPGLYIYSTFPNHPYAINKSLNYDFGSGTSMSTPHVAGLAALVWATGYGTSNSTVRQQIESTADAIPGTGTYWIYGRINACNAVGGNCTYGGEQPTPTPTATPTVTPTPTATPTPSPGNTMHVAAIDMWYTRAGPNYFIYTKVTIVDSANSPVSGATVYLTTTLPDGSAVASSGDTGDDGTITFKLKSQLAGTYTSTVTDVVKSGWIYDRLQNTETSDSITVP